MILLILINLIINIFSKILLLLLVKLRHKDLSFRLSSGIAF